jgi:hypothetical protein
MPHLRLLTFEMAWKYVVQATPFRIQKPLGMTPLAPVFLLNPLKEDNLVLQMVSEGPSLFIQSIGFCRPIQLLHMGKKGCLKSLFPYPGYPQSLMNYLMLWAMKFQASVLPRWGPRLARKDSNFTRTKSPKSGSSNHQVWNINPAGRHTASSPLFNMRGIWSNPTLVIVVSE